VDRHHAALGTGTALAAHVLATAVDIKRESRLSCRRGHSPEHERPRVTGRDTSRSIKLTLTNWTSLRINLATRAALEHL
jgi:hypothetical protein